MCFDLRYLCSWKIVKPHPCPCLLCVFRRIAKATGGQVVLTLADMEGNESYDASTLGTAEEVAETQVADDAMVSLAAQGMGFCVRLGAQLNGKPACSSTGVLCGT